MEKRSENKEGGSTEKPEREDGVIPSSDVETDKMEEMEDKESDLDRMSGIRGGQGEAGEEHEGEGEQHEGGQEGGEGEGEGQEGQEGDNQQDKQSHDHDNQQDHDHDSQQDHDKPNNDLPDERHTSSHLPTVQTSSSEDIETSDSLDETKELEQKKLKEAEDDEREQNRLTAMNELKEIEIDFAHLKDKLYETQLKKLEFELKLCEMNKHPDFVYFMKMIDENFKGRIERSINLQKNRLRCLDNQTRAYRVQIHQQFIKNCEDLKYREIRRITSDWYEINKERRTMDTASLQSPEYYQYNEHITAKNVEEQGTINELVRQRNALYREISNMEGMVKYKRVFPSSLNYIKGCDDEEMEVDLREMTS